MATWTIYFQWSKPGQSPNFTDNRFIVIEANDPRQNAPDLLEQASNEPNIVAKLHPDAKKNPKHVFADLELASIVLTTGVPIDIIQTVNDITFITSGYGEPASGIILED